MTEAMWIALFGVLGTLLSGLGVNILASRSREKERGDQRYREVQDQARLAIFEVIDTTRQWLMLMSPVAIVVAQKDIEEVLAAVQGSAGENDMRRARDAAGRAMTKAKLLVADDAIRQQLDALANLSRGWLFDVLQTPEGTPRFGTPELDESRKKAWKAAEAAFVANLRHLEKLTAEATAVPVKR